jgi:hypothetical protein
LRHSSSARIDPRTSASDSAAATNTRSPAG